MEGEKKALHEQEDGGGSSTIAISEDEDPERNDSATAVEENRSRNNGPIHDHGTRDETDIHNSSNGVLNNHSQQKQNTADENSVEEERELKDIIKGATAVALDSEVNSTSTPNDYPNSHNISMIHTTTNNTTSSSRRYSPSNLSEITKPDPPPSIVDCDEIREEDFDDTLPDDDRGSNSEDVVVVTADDSQLEGQGFPSASATSYANNTHPKEISTPDISSALNGAAQAPNNNAAEDEKVRPSRTSLREEETAPPTPLRSLPPSQSATPVGGFMSHELQQMDAALGHPHNMERPMHSFENRPLDIVDENSVQNMNNSHHQHHSQVTHNETAAQERLHYPVPTNGSPSTPPGPPLIQHQVLDSTSIYQPLPQPQPSFQRSSSFGHQQQQQLPDSLYGYGSQHSASQQATMDLSYGPDSQHRPSSLPTTTAMMEQSYVYLGHQLNESSYGHHSQPPPYGHMTRAMANGHSGGGGGNSNGGGGPRRALPAPAPAPLSGRRKIRLRMEEEILNYQDENNNDESRPGLLRSIRRKSRLMFGSSEILIPISEGKTEAPKFVDRGLITLSWFEGTSTLELQEHVRRSVTRKLKLPNHIQLVDFRVLDESTDEEIVLSPFIPHGSEFLLRFSTRDISKERHRQHPSDGTLSPVGRAPDSPSAAPSPHPETGHAGGLSSRQLAHLSKKLDALRPMDDYNHSTRSLMTHRRRSSSSKEVSSDSVTEVNGEGQSKINQNNPKAGETEDADTDEKKDENAAKSGDEETSDDDDDMMLHSEDPIEARLRQITEILLRDREEATKKNAPARHDKRQVIFVLANYFVLFLSLIAISAEIQARAPGWITMLENEMQSVQNCAANQEALFECVSRGDFAGLIASCMLWLSRSVATKRVFLFGFESPKKLWTVVYESLVTAFCWGFSYLFIRRGLNSDTRHRFIQKFWKDAVYGSLAGFNAAFMKQVLKNLIPEEAVEDALRERHLKILSWLPNFTD